MSCCVWWWNASTAKDAAYPALVTVAVSQLCPAHVVDVHPDGYALTPYQARDPLDLGCVLRPGVSRFHASPLVSVRDDQDRQDRRAAGRRGDPGTDTGTVRRNKGDPRADDAYARNSGPTDDVEPSSPKEASVMTESRRGGEPQLPPLHTRMVPPEQAA
jgi:hypothetical protein